MEMTMKKIYGYAVKWNKVKGRYRNETCVFLTREAAIRELNHLILDESCLDARLFKVCLTV